MEDQATLKKPFNSVKSGEQKMLEKWIQEQTQVLSAIFKTDITIDLTIHDAKKSTVAFMNECKNGTSGNGSFYMSKDNNSVRIYDKDYLPM